MQWFLGDWVNFGYSQFVAAMGGKRSGDKYRIALESLPYNYQSLRDIAWVCDSIPLSRRRDKLSFQHHREVAGLDPRDQARFLNMAEKDDLPVQDLRALIRRESADVSPSEDTLKLPETFTTWTTRARLVLQRERIEDWSPARKAATKAELQFFVDLYNRL